MSIPFEEELRGYLQSKTPGNSTLPMLPAGFEATPDPRYAYNGETGHWLDLGTGTVSYYDEKSRVYVPLYSIDARPETNCFTGVARLVVLESDCLVHGQVAEIDGENGMYIGRDHLENGYACQLRLPDIEVSRHHARVYFGAKADVLDGHGEGSEDGEIEDDGGNEADGLSENGAQQGTNLEPQPDHQLFLIDQGSTHGTFVNGNRVCPSKTASKPYPLTHLDRISMGGSMLEVHIHEQWACSKCSSVGSSDISAQNTRAREREAAAVAHAMPPVDLRKERVSNLQAIKRKYSLASPRSGEKPGRYVDRARIRRSMQSGIHAPSNPQADAQEAPARCSPEASPQDQGSIGEGNKGFAMLQKMGWAPGTGLGADQGGMVDPVVVQGNSERTGLGASQHPESPRSKAGRITRERFDKA
ncbi:hypothetical protein GGF46_003912 [Coemansia sp. RSA 552]|nr:hypothetical protein GGF46_003912 [Coemansia sp. RSA 552]